MHTERNSVARTALAALVATFLASGCTCGGPGGNDGGTGGGSAGEPDMAAASQDVAKPLDATPDPDGQNIYFIANDPVKGTGVFKVAAAGGPATVVHVGDPFSAPMGISISGDGNTLFVTDPSATTGTGELEDRGQLFSLPAGGGTPTPVASSGGKRPRNLDIVAEGGADKIYFTGRDDTGKAGVFSGTTSGGFTAVSLDAVFVDPSGIAVAANGDVYVADTLGPSEPFAKVFRISGGTVSEFVTGLKVGYPVGLSLNKDGSKLFISALDPEKFTDVVIIVNVADGTQTQFVGDTDTNITNYDEPAGLHRARNADTFSWADRTAPNGATTGTVFKISF